MIPMTKSEEVTAALAEGAAVVALESTIVTHGLPWPRNLETARAVEAAVRDAGAVPATIALLDSSRRWPARPTWPSCPGPTWPRAWHWAATARPPWRRP